MPMKISGDKVLMVIPTSREGLGGKLLMVIPASQEGRGGEILVMAHTSVLEGILLKEIQGRVTLTEITFLGWRKNNRKSNNCLGNPEVAP